jgi:hypothetical protein
MLIHFPTGWAPVKGEPSVSPSYTKETKRDARRHQRQRRVVDTLIIDRNSSRFVYASLEHARSVRPFCRFGMSTPWYPRRCSFLWSSLVKPFVPFRAQLFFGQSMYSFSCTVLRCRATSALRVNDLEHSGQYCGSLESHS